MSRIDWAATVGKVFTVTVSNYAPDFGLGMLIAAKSCVLVRSSRKGSSFADH